MDKYLEILSRHLHQQSDGEVVSALRAAIDLMRAADSNGPVQAHEAGKRDALRAAEPKDPKAEREHCEQAYKHLLLEDRHPVPVVDLVERERAAARAEGVADGFKHGVAARLENSAAWGELQAQLSAAQAEIELMRAAQSETDLEVRNESLVEMRERFISQGREEMRVRLERLQEKLAIEQKESELVFRHNFDLGNKLSAAQDTVALQERAGYALADQLSAAQVEIGRLRADYAKAGQDYASECKLRDMLETKLSNLRTAAEPFAKRYGENADIWTLRAALDSTPATLSKQDLEQVPRSWLELENENLKKNLAALEASYNKLLEKMK